MRRNRLLPVIGLLLLSIVLSSGCGTLRTARIRKDVTINTFLDPDFRIRSHSVIAVVLPLKKEGGLNRIPISTHEAAQDMMSLKLWQKGFHVIDKIFVKELLEQEKIALEDFSVDQAVKVGRKLRADYIMLVSMNDFEEDVRSVDFGPFNVIDTVDTSALVGLNCRLVDVAAEKVVWTGVATTQDKNLQLSLRRISEHLIFSLHADGEGQEPEERELPGIGLHY